MQKNAWLSPFKSLKWMLRQWKDNMLPFFALLSHITSLLNNTNKTMQPWQPGERSCVKCMSEPFSGYDFLTFLQVSHIWCVTNYLHLFQTLPQTIKLVKCLFLFTIRAIDIWDWYLVIYKCLEFKSIFCVCPS